MRDPFRNFNQYKIDPLSEIRNAGIVTNGSVFWVSSVNDSDHRVRTDDLGNGEVKLTLQEAVNAMRNDRNDYALVIPTDSGTVRPLGTAFDVNKNRAHVLGVGAKTGFQTSNGLTFRGYVSASVNDSELVRVTGAGVEMGGLKFVGTSGTAATGTITATFRVSAEAAGTPHDLWLHDMTIENTQAAAAGGTAPVFEVTGDVPTGIGGFTAERCWIGNRSWAPTPLVNYVGGTAGPSRGKFEDCMFVIDAQATTDRFVTVGTGETEYTVFKNCEFINVEAGTLPASVFTGALLVDNPLLLRNNSYVNATAAGTDTEAYKSPAYSGTAAAITDVGISIGTAAIIPA